MKIIEIISENKKTDTLRKDELDSMTNLQLWPELDNNNSPYTAFRFGQHMAACPRNHDIPKNGPVGGKFVTMAYTDGDQEILDAAAKSMGVKSLKQNTKQSKESDNTNNVSPIPKYKKNKYGI